MRFTKALGALAAFLAVAASGQVTNQNSIPLTLEEAIQRAMEHNLNLQIESLTPSIVGYALQGAYAGWDPFFESEISRRNTSREGSSFNPVTGTQIGASRAEFDTVSGSLNGLTPIGMTYQLSAGINETKTSRPFQTTNRFGAPVFPNFHTDEWGANAQISVQQPLLRNFWIDSTRLAIKLAKEDVKISELELKFRTLTLVRDVEKAYYDLVSALANIQVAEADLGVKQRLYNENRRKVEIGTLAPLDEKQAQAEVARSRATLVSARNSAGAAENLLQSLITDQFANQVGITIIPTDKLTDLPPLLNLQDSFQRAVTMRPDLEQFRSALTQREIRLKYDYNQLFPELNVFASWGVNGLDPELSGAIRDVERKDFQQDSYGVFLRFPLTFRQERSNYRAARLDKARAILQLKAKEEEIVTAVDNAVREVQSAYERIGFARDAVLYAEAALDAARKRLEVGRATSFEVLQLASDLAVARFAEVQALRDYNRALADLSFAEGTTLEKRRMDFKVK